MRLGALLLWFTSLATLMDRVASTARFFPLNLNYKR